MVLRGGGVLVSEVTLYRCVGGPTPKPRSKTQEGLGSTGSRFLLIVLELLRVERFGVRGKGFGRFPTPFGNFFYELPKTDTLFPES